jgi:two-component system phosphate regulon response regulator PhoB
MSTSPAASWLAFADRGVVNDVAELVGPRSVVTTTDPAEFGDLLRTSRARIAILATPPAGPAEIDAALQARRRRPHLRVVVVSPPDAIQERLDALRRGADEAHPQSIDPAELAERLSILEARAGSRQDDVLPVTDDTVIDLVAREARRDGALIHLRPKEFQLLVMLASHPGRAYSRRQLLDRIWGPGHDGDPRTVDVHIRWLRSKIEPRPEAPVHLMTVRGFGYRLDPTTR